MFISYHIFATNITYNALRLNLNQEKSLISLFLRPNAIDHSYINI